MTHPFEITAGDIGQLRDDSTLFANVVSELAEDEVIRSGLRKSRVRFSHNQSAPDGGIDIRIDATGAAGSEFLPDRDSIWQCKAGTFEPKDLEGELKKGEVKDAIAGGATYVLAQTADLTAQMIKNRREKVEEVIPGTDFRILGARDIADWASSHPQALRRFKRSRGGFEFAEEWLDRQDLHRIRYHWTPTAEAVRDALLEWAEQENGSRVIRLFGRPGVGKSRLALETFRDHQSGPIYAAKAAQIAPDFWMQIRHRRDMSGILIVDECSAESTEEISQRVQMAEGDFRVIAIGHDRVPGPFEHLQIEQLTHKELQDFLRSTYPQLTPRQMLWIADLVDGYVRLAHELAKRVAEAGLGAHLVGMQLSDIVGKLIPKSHLNVMKALSLQTAVGWEKDLADEGKALCAHMGLDNWADARRQVAEMEEIGYVNDAGRMRYVTPELLAVWLAAQEWQINSELLLQLRPKLSIQAQGRFDARLGSMDGVEGANEFVQEVLSGRGPFRDLSVLDDVSNSRLLLELAKVSPDAALAALHRILDPCSLDQLRSFHRGRRHTVFALERLVSVRRRFPGAASLLLRLAAAENERYANNATGVFTGLFNPLSGPTEATGDERLARLAEALHSTHIEEILVAVSSLNKALDLSRSGVIVDASAGVKPRPYWRVQSYDERRSYRLGALDLLNQASADSRPEIRQAAHSVFFERFTMLFRVGLGDEALDLAESSTFDEPEQRVLWNNAAQILRRSEGELALSAEQTARLEQLQRAIFGDTLGDRLRRGLGSQVEVSKSRSTEERHQLIAELVEDALAQPDELEAELPWLASTEATFAYGFASTLAARDSGRHWQQSFFGAARDAANPPLATGYLVGLHEAGTISSLELEAVLDDWARDRATASFVVSVTAIQGMTQERADLLLTMLGNDMLDARQLAPLVMSQPDADLSFTTVTDLVRPLVGGDSQLASAGWMIARRAFERERESEQGSVADSVATLLDLVTCDAALPSGYRDAFDEHTWAQCVFLLLPEKASPIATAIMTAVATREMMLPEDGEAGNVLRSCIKSDPRTIWPDLARTIEKAKGWGGQELTHWAAQVRLTDTVPLGFLRDWVGSRGQESEGSAMLLSRLTNFERVLTPLMRWLIEEYGARSKVAERIMIDTGVKFWSGSAAAAEQPRIEALKLLASDESGEVRRWAEIFIEDIQAHTTQLDKRSEEARFG